MTIRKLQNIISRYKNCLPEWEYLCIGIDPDNADDEPFLYGAHTAKDLYRDIRRQVRWDRTRGGDAYIWVMPMGSNKALVIPGRADICAELFPYYADQVCSKIFEGEMTLDEVEIELANTERWIEVVG